MKKVTYIALLSAFITLSLASPKAHADFLGIGKALNSFKSNGQNTFVDKDKEKQWQACGSLWGCGPGAKKPVRIHSGPDFTAQGINPLTGQPYNIG